MSSWPHAYDHLFRLLRGVSSGGPGRWYARCPAHDDARASLSISLGSRSNLIMRCHAPAGCAAREIVRAVGLTLADLYEDNDHATGRKFDPRRCGSGRPAVTTKRRAIGKLEATYPYRDEGGELLYEVLRFAGDGTGKEMRQRRANPAFDGSRPEDKAANPRYLWSLSGVRRVLYRLPELIGALRDRPNEPVAVVEGERNVDDLWSVGVLATCNSEGAGKWGSVAELARSVLKGRKVAVVADDDPFIERAGCRPGVAHAFDVAANLKGCAASIKVLRLFTDERKKDVSDWLPLQTGDKRRAFWTRVAQEPEWDGVRTSFAAPRGEESFDALVAGEAARLAAKSRGPRLSSAEAVGLIALAQASLQEALTRPGRSGLVAAMARLCAVARHAGEGVARGQHEGVEAEE